ncbi:metallophosphoesterase [Patescibacteria group bacterium]|nr:metallophosphoesterase [Patescibacteria group bacterium]
MKKKYKIFTFIISIGCLLITYAYFVEPNILKVENQTITLTCLKSDISDINFLQISDLHFSEDTPKEKIDRLINEITKQKAVAIFITGDLITNKNGIDNISYFLGNISKSFPTFIVLGNWDYSALNYKVKDFKNILEKAGAKVLLNDSFNLSVDKENIELVGIIDPDSSEDSKKDLTEAFGTINDSRCKILLSHSPGIIKIATEKDIDLVLAGHTHGGQVYIPFLSETLIPSNEDGKGFVKGSYQYENTQMYINRGIGISGLPFRFLNSPEITLINLTN